MTYLPVTFVSLRFNVLRAQEPLQHINRRGRGRNKVKFMTRITSFLGSQKLSEKDSSRTSNYLNLEKIRLKKNYVNE